MDLFPRINIVIAYLIRLLSCITHPSKCKGSAPYPGTLAIYLHLQFLLLSTDLFFQNKTFTHVFC